MAWYEWVFDGIGSSIISLVLGLLIGGVSGAAIQKHKTNVKQRQTINAPVGGDVTQSSKNSI